MPAGHFRLKKHPVSVVPILSSYIQPCDMGEEYIHSNNCYEWYYEIGRDVAPKSIVEIGVRFGYSGVALRLGSIEAEYYGYDKEIKDYGMSNDKNVVDLKIARENLRRSSPAACYVVKTDTQHCPSLPLIHENKSIDLVNIDGDHSKEGCLHDCDLALKTVKPEGLILVDDVDFFDLTDVVTLWADTHDLYWEYYPTFRGMLAISESRFR